MTFLIADDCFTNRLVIKIFLEKNGYKVTETDDGTGVIDLIKNGETYEIIFLDLQMPKLDGIECTEQLRKKYGYQKPIIGITCFADKESSDACVAAGMDDVLPKPINEKTLLLFIKKYSS